MQLCQKQNEFSELVAAFSKARLNFEHLEKKYPPHSWCVSHIADSKKHG